MKHETRDAIARIDVLQNGTSVSRGTGTLVGPGIVLTALHVVADRRADPPQPIQGRISLTFPSGHQTEATIRGTLMDPKGDWVLLDCATPPPGVTPVRLGKLSESGVQWETYGFPDAKPDGMVQTGTVKSFEAELGGALAFQLFSEEAGAGDGAPVKGLSGAPVIVDDWLVGHLRFALMGQDQKTVAGTVFACPAATVADASQGLVALGQMPARRSTTTVIITELEQGQRRTRWIMVAGTLLLAMVLGVVVYRMGPKPTLLVRAAAKTIAVLRFTGDTGGGPNLGGGMREIIIAELRKINALKVIDLGNFSSDSASPGNDAGVVLPPGVDAGAIFKGVIISTGGKFQIQLTLLKARQAGGWDRTWSQTYPVNGSNAFAVQQEVARQVAGELDAQMTASESLWLTEAHTRDSSAAEFFLLGKDLLARAFFDKEAAQRAAVMFNRSVVRDPGFAIAFARLSEAHSLIYYLGIDTSATRRAQSWAAAETALALEPDLPEGHLARGAYHYRIGGHNELAERELAIARKALPHDSNLLLMTGLVLRRDDQWRQALCYLRDASDLEPGGWAPAYYAGQTYLFVRDYANARTYFERAVSDSAEAAQLDQRARAYLNLAALYLAQDGDTAKAAVTVHQASLAFDPATMLAAFSLDEFRPLLRVVGLTPHLDSLLRREPRAAGTDSSDYYLAKAILSRRASATADARAFFDSAIAVDRRRTALSPLAGEPHVDLGQAYAGMGQTRLAVQEGERAVDLLGPGGEWVGSRTVAAVATQWAMTEIYLAANDMTAALYHVSQQLWNPGYLSPAWIEADPLFTSLRADPRYQEVKRVFLQRREAPLARHGSHSMATSCTST